MISLHMETCLVVPLRDIILVQYVVKKRIRNGKNMGIRTHIPTIGDFFHVIIHLESKRRYLMVNKSSSYLRKNLLEMKYLDRLIPFVTHGEEEGQTKGILCYLFKLLEEEVYIL